MGCNTEHSHSLAVSHVPPQAAALHISMHQKPAISDNEEYYTIHDANDNTVQPQELGHASKWQTVKQNKSVSISVICRSLLFSFINQSFPLHYSHLSQLNIFIIPPYFSLSQSSKFPASLSSM